jgi:tetratricopeptide (TPR) repeat protein
VPDAEERAWLEPALGGLLGIDDVRQQAREQLYSAWRTFFERVSEKGPVLLVFEDIQWADTGLLDFIEHLLEWVRDKPILIVTLARPEILERRPNFGMNHRAFAALHLEPLPDEAMRALLKGLVPDLADADLANIVARAEGVPLYAVETVRALVDQGHLVREGNVYTAQSEIPVIGIPPTLRALIASRLDGLDPTDRDLVQDASVIGTVFAVPTLAALSGRTEEEVQQRLRALCSREFMALETDPRSPERGQYRFTQGLLREVAYNTLGKRERRTRHLAAARYLETVGDEELAGVVATHYSEAYRAVPEGDEGAAVAAQARVALRAAADRAARLFSNDQALAYYEQALSVTFDESDQIDLRLQAGRAAAATGAFERSFELFQTALDWLLAHDQAQTAAHVASDYAQALLIGSRIDEAMEMLAGIIERVPDDDPAVVSLHGHIARGHLFGGDAEPAMEALARGLAIAERAGMRAEIVQLLITKSWALTKLRRSVEATTLLIGAIQMADEGSDLLARIRARFNLVGYMGMHDQRRAADLAAEGIALSRQFGFAVHAANMAGNVAPSLVLLGEFDELLRLVSDVERANSPMAANVHGYSSIVHALRGDQEAAAALIERVRRAMEGTSSAQDIASKSNQQAFVILAAGDLDSALTLAREGRDVYFGSASVLGGALAVHIDALRGDRAGLMADRPYLAENFIFGDWVERNLRNCDAALASLDGRVDEGRGDYRRLIADWRAAGNRLDLALTLLERSRLLPDDAESSEGRREAEEILAQLGATSFLETLDAALPPIAPARTDPVGKTALSQTGAAAATH